MSRGSRRNGAYKICEACKRPHYVPKYRVVTARFCSRRCLGKAMLPAIHEPRLAAIRDKHAHNFEWHFVVCLQCDDVFPCSPSRKNKKFCSQECYGVWQRAHNCGEYIRVTVNGKRMLEHRYVMSQVIERDLLPEEQVDHINRIKRDNHPGNLRILDPVTHGRLSASFRGKPITPLSDNDAVLADSSLSSSRG